MRRFLWIGILVFVLSSVYSTSAEYTGDDYRYVYIQEKYVDAPEVLITEYLGNDRNVTVPDLIDDTPVVEIAGLGFAYNENLQWLSIPASVKRISAYIVLECPSLRDIWFLGDAPKVSSRPLLGDPDTVTIHYLAGKSGFTNPWYGYRAIASPNLPPDYAHPLQSSDGMWEFSLSGRNIVLTKYIGTGLDVVVPSTIDGLPVTTISANTFAHRYPFETAVAPLNRLVIPDSVTTIEPNACSWLLWMEQLYLGDGITVIPDGAFYQCVSLQEIRFPKNLQEIGKRAFSLCVSLGVVRIADTVTTIGDEAFRENVDLEMVIMGRDLEKIGRDVFEECPNLQEIRFKGKPPQGLSSMLQNPSQHLKITYPAEISGYPQSIAGAPCVPYYRIMYQSGSISGSKKPVISYDPEPYLSGEEAIVADPVEERIAREFLGWNTREDGSGTLYEPGDMLPVTNQSIRLYAQYGEFLEEEDVHSFPVVSSTKATDWIGTWNTDWGDYRIQSVGDRLIGKELDGHWYFEGKLVGNVCSGTYGELHGNRRKMQGYFQFTLVDSYRFKGYQWQTEHLPPHLGDEWNGEKWH